MHRLLIVSNRLPVSIDKTKQGLVFRKSVGGLATGLSSFYKSYDSLWIGWCGIPLEKLGKKEKENLKKKLLNDFNSFPIFLSRRDIEMYYSGFCNKTIWPLFHSFTQYVVYDKGLWKSYGYVNRLFYNAIKEIAKPGDIIWVHDYHLMLLPKFIKENMPDVTIGFFLHIPFPSYEIFRLLPWRKEILEGILYADLIGFHTYDYVRHFLSSVRRIKGYENTLGQLNIKNRIVKVDSFPMGIDYEKFSVAGENPKIQDEINRIHKKVGDRRIILSIDRLDYTKGILQRLKAFDLFLEKNPEYRNKVTLILVAVPSRTRVEHYRLLKNEMDELIGNINGKHGNIGWVPVWYLYRSLPFQNLVALYKAANIALITPLRDGMNLIAKEFIATKNDGKGILILSEMAGASNELGEAIIVNPNDREEIAKAIKKAMVTSYEEQNERNRIMQRRLKRYNVVRWANDFMGGLSNIKELQKELEDKLLVNAKRKRLIRDYAKGKERLIFLDYDGTLVPFAERPENAKPDVRLLGLFEKLAHNDKNNVVLISGRRRPTLEMWFNNLDVGLIAEHGAWLRKSGEEWETIEPLKSGWKKKIKPLLEFYVDRTPNTFIEEKEFALVWHYRKAAPELAMVRVRELKDNLLQLITHLKLGVLEGSKVIEIKKADINKGKAALRWISRKKWDFILGIGDDWTDEDLFQALPDSAYSIKVGLGYSEAKFTIESYKDVRILLKEMGTL